MSLSRVIAVSGGFDPVHVGHLEMIEQAYLYSNVMVILNSDEWLMRKKGYVFMPFNERKRILEAFRKVYQVVPAIDTDDTVCESLRHYRPYWFGNGGDRTTENTPEQLVCDELGIQMVWGLGQKIQSSSDLVKNARGK